MGLRIGLEMLAVLLLLTPLMSGGLLIPKCKLVEDLELTVPEGVADRENLVAELTCRAEIASQFETSCITKVSSQDLSRVRRAAPQATNSPITTKSLVKSGANPLAKTTTNLHLESDNNPLPKTSTNPSPKTINTRMDPYNNPLPKTSTNPSPKTINTRMDPYNNPLPKTSTNPSPKTINTRMDSYNNPLPKTSTIPRLKSRNNLLTPPYTTPPLGSKTILLPKTKESRSLASKLLEPVINPQEPVIKQAEEEIYPPSNYPPVQDATPSPPLNFNSTFMSPRKRRALSGLLTLYGVFQLADRVACISSANITSFNLCKLHCHKLTDDSITDDINCVLTILKSRSDRDANPEIQDEANRLTRKLSSMLTDTCPDLDEAKYLAECQKP